MNFNITIEIPAYNSKCTTREQQSHRNRVAEILKLMASRLSNGGAGDMQFDLEGLTASMTVEPAHTGRHAA